MVTGKAPRVSQQTSRTMRAHQMRGALETLPVMARPSRKSRIVLTGWKDPGIFQLHRKNQETDTFQVTADEKFDGYSIDFETAAGQSLPTTRPHPLTASMSKDISPGLDNEHC